MELQNCSAKKTLLTNEVDAKDVCMVKRKSSMVESSRQNYGINCQAKKVSQKETISEGDTPLLQTLLK